MSRVAVVFPWADGGLDADEEAKRRRLVREAASPETSLELIHTTGYSAMSEGFSAGKAQRVASAASEAIQRAARTAPDAIMVWGGIDPGIEDARARVVVPVVATAQSTYAVAAQLGGRLGLVVYEEALIEPVRDLVRRYGGSVTIAGIRHIGLPQPELHRRRAEVPERLLDACRALVADDGATAIYPQGMSMVPSAIGAATLQDQLGVPVLDALQITMRTAELIGGLGLARSISAPR